jgi:hypothetical protein
MQVFGNYKTTHIRDGEVLGIYEKTNLIPDAALNDILDVVLGNGTQKTAWYLAPMDVNHTPAAADTYADSCGTGNYESTDYSEANRQTWTPGTVSGQSVDNSASIAAVTMQGNDTAIYGWMLVSDNTKGDTAASGAILASMVLYDTAITGIVNGDELRCELTLTASSSLTSGALVVNEGLDHLLSSYFAGGTQITTWYLAPMDTDHTPAAADTYADSCGTGAYETTDYDEANRVTCQFGSASSQSIDNSANKATFTAGGTDTTWYGYMLVSDNTKGDTAASGAVLYDMVLFSAARTGIGDGDSIKIEATATMAAA